jgi:dethiobiotin synthetase
MSGLLVAGTGSDVGKSVVVAGICRWLARRGVKVAPFKAQNISLNSAVTPDGAEVGRAQVAQAAAAGVAPEAAMNPILLKPAGERSSQLVVMGRPFAEVDARSYQQLKPRLRAVVLDALASLRGRYDVVVCEGAGSPAEINLRDADLVNLGLARAAGLPVVFVGDINRGGVFASLFGTLALLDAADQALVAGFLVNKFRGDEAILRSGLEQLRRLTGRPVLGVLPWRRGLWLDAEDSLALESPRDGLAPLGGDRVVVAVVRLRWLSNFTDVDALAAEPGVVVRFTESAAEVLGADLAVVPGTKATVSDLAWLRASGLDRALVPLRDARCRPLGSAAATSCSASGSWTTSRAAPERSQVSACCRSRRSSTPARSWPTRPGRFPGWAACRWPATRFTMAAPRRTPASRCSQARATWAAAWARWSASAGTASSTATSSGGRSSAGSRLQGAWTGFLASGRSRPCARSGWTPLATWSPRMPTPRRSTG